MHELRRWDLPGVDWHVKLPELPERSVVDHHWVHQLNELRDMCCRQIRRDNWLHELRGWNIPGIDRGDGVRLLRKWLGLGDSRSDSVERLLDMHEREIRCGWGRELLELRCRDI